MALPPRLACPLPVMWKRAKHSYTRSIGWLLLHVSYKNSVMSKNTVWYLILLLLSARAHFLLYNSYRNDANEKQILYFSWCPNFIAGEGELASLVLNLVTYSNNLDTCSELPLLSPHTRMNQIFQDAKWRLDQIPAQCGKVSSLSNIYHYTYRLLDFH